MTDAPWLGEMTAEERAGAIRCWLVNIGAVNLDGIAAAIRDAEQRAAAKMREAAAKVAETTRGFQGRSSDGAGRYSLVINARLRRQAEDAAVAIKRLP